MIRIAVLVDERLALLGSRRILGLLFSVCGFDDRSKSAGGARDRRKRLRTATGAVFRQA